MLKPENKIFKNLYNDHGWEIDHAIRRDDWKDTKNIISKGYNKVEEKNNPLYHAEKIAIDKALLKTNKRYLDNCDIWVTLQPCKMCMEMIKQVRIKRLYYGASIPNSSIKNKINDRVCSEIYSGIREDECSKLIKDFFKKIRSD